MRIKKSKQKRSGYTLIETLVASSIIMLAIGAASTLSLAMVTQEETAERAVRVANYLENAATLYRLGIDVGEIQSILPVEPVIVNFSATPQNQIVNGVSVDFTTISVEYRPTGAISTNSSGVRSWTGGDSNLTRTHSVQVLRGNP